MRKVYVVAVACLACLLGSAALTHGQAPEFPVLSKIEIVPVEAEFYRPPIVPVKCDSDGNVYYRPAINRAMGLSPVVRISADGRKTTTMDISAAPEFSKGGVSIRDFTVSPRGDVYMIGTDLAKDRTVILRFDSQGKYSSTIVLAQTLVPSRLAALLGGMFLVTGSEFPFPPDLPREKRTAAGPRRAITAVIGAEGNVVREVLLKSDGAEKLREEAKSEKSEPPQPAEKAAKKVPAGARSAAIVAPLSPAEPAAKKTAAQQWEETLAFTKMSAALDGNVYLMRPSRPPVVYVISAAGEVLRRLEPEVPGEGYQPLDMAVGDGQIAIFFWKPASDPRQTDIRQQVYSLYNAITGERIASYQVNPAGAGTPVCYSVRDGFTFFRAGTTGKAEIVHAKP